MHLLALLEEKEKKKRNPKIEALSDGASPYRPLQRVPGRLPLHKLQTKLQEVSLLL